MQFHEKMAVGGQGLEIFDGIQSGWNHIDVPLFTIPYKYNGSHYNNIYSGVKFPHSFCGGENNSIEEECIRCDAKVDCCGDIGN